MSKVLPSATALVSKHLEAGFLETAIGDCLLWFSHGRCLFHSVSWRRAIRQRGGTCMLQETGQIQKSQSLALPSPRAAVCPEFYVLVI